MAGLAEQKVSDVAHDAMIASYLSSRFPLGQRPSVFEGDDNPSKPSERALGPAAAFWQNPSNSISDENENVDFILNQLLHDISRPLDWALACDAPCETNYAPEELDHLPMRRMLIPAQALQAARQHKDSAGTYLF